MTTTMESTGAANADSFHSTWARLVSDVLSPPVIWAVLAFPMAFHDAATQEQAFIAAIVYGLLVCWLPVGYIYWNVRSGKITDIHIKVRQQRLRPFLVSILCAGVAFCALLLFDAPRLMPLFALFSLIQIAIMTVVTLVWQISMHAMSISGAVVAAAALYGTGAGLLMLPLLLVVSAARLRLRRHTLAQVIAGALVGAVMTALLFALV
jgi:hypothetical protein